MTDINPHWKCQLAGCQTTKPSDDMNDAEWLLSLVNRVRHMVFVRYKPEVIVNFIDEVLKDRGQDDKTLWKSSLKSETF